MKCATMAENAREVTHHPVPVLQDTKAHNANMVSTCRGEKCDISELLIIYFNLQDYGKSYMSLPNFHFCPHIIIITGCIIISVLSNENLDLFWCLTFSSFIKSLSWDFHTPDNRNVTNTILKRENLPLKAASIVITKPFWIHNYLGSKHNIRDIFIYISHSTK